MELGPGDGTLTMDDTREFRQKLKLLLIDKLVLGGFLLLLGLFVQLTLEQQRVEFAEQTRIRDVTLAISQVFAETVDADRKAIATAVRDLLVILNRTESDGIVTDTNTGRSLQDSVENIENALARLRRMDRDFAPIANHFKDIVGGVRNRLENEGRQPSEFQDDIDLLLDEYGCLMTALRRVSVRAFEEDREAVDDMLSERGPGVMERLWGYLAGG